MSMNMLNITTAVLFLGPMSQFRGPHSNRPASDCLHVHSSIGVDIRLSVSRIPRGIRSSKAHPPKVSAFLSSHAVVESDTNLQVYSMRFGEAACRCLYLQPFPPRPKRMERMAMNSLLEFLLAINF